MSDNVFTMTFEDGTSMPYTLLCTFSADGRDYAALMPEDGSNEIVFYRVEAGNDADGNEGVVLSALKSDMEFDLVLSVFDSFVTDVSDDLNDEDVKSKINSVSGDSATND